MDSLRPANGSRARLATARQDGQRCGSFSRPLLEKKACSPLENTNSPAQSRQVRVRSWNTLSRPPVSPNRPGLSSRPPAPSRRADGADRRARRRSTGFGPGTHDAQNSRHVKRCSRPNLARNRHLDGIRRKHRGSSVGPLARVPPIGCAGTTTCGNRRRRSRRPGAMPDLWIRLPVTGRWPPSAHPDLVAASLRQRVDEPRPAPPAPAPARLRPPRSPRRPDGRRDRPQDRRDRRRSFASRRAAASSRSTSSPARRRASRSTATA
jgi:hypothetical protein